MSVCSWEICVVYSKSPFKDRMCVSVVQLWVWSPLVKLVLTGAGVDFEDMFNVLPYFSLFSHLTHIS